MLFKREHTHFFFFFVWLADMERVINLSTRFFRSGVTAVDSLHCTEVIVEIQMCLVQNACGTACCCGDASGTQLRRQWNSG